MHRAWPCSYVDRLTYTSLHFSFCRSKTPSIPICWGGGYEMKQLTSTVTSQQEGSLDWGGGNVEKMY